jgi:uncharacterized protein (TIGR02594 family)
MLFLIPFGTLLRPSLENALASINLYDLFQKWKSLMTKLISLATSLNLRKRPMATATSPILRVLPRYAVIDEIDANSDRSWISVRYDGVTGWLNTAYLLPFQLYEELPWIKRAGGEFGVAEIPGSTDNPRIAEYQRSINPTTTAGDKPAWCSRFVNWCLEPLGYATQPQINAKARSWKKWGYPSEFRPGSIVVFWRRPGSKEGTAAERKMTPDQLRKTGTRGHVGFFIEERGDLLIVLGGNQGNRVSLQAYPKEGIDYGYMTMRWPHGEK